MDLVRKHPIYLRGRELLVKDVDNVDDVGGLQHVRVVGKCPRKSQDDYHQEGDGDGGTLALRCSCTCRWPHCRSLCIQDFVRLCLFHPGLVAWLIINARSTRLIEISFRMWMSKYVLSNIWCSPSLQVMHDLKGKPYFHLLHNFSLEVAIRPLFAFLLPRVFCLNVRDECIPDHLRS